MLAPGINPSGFALGMGNLLKTLKDEVARISQKLDGKPQAIGLGFPGAVDPEVGVVYMPGKIKGLEGYPIVKRLAKATGIPVVADNDGRISIYAEQVLRSSAGCGMGGDDHPWHWRRFRCLARRQNFARSASAIRNANEPHRHAGPRRAAVPDQCAGHGRDDVLGYGADSAGAGRAGARHSLGLERPVLRGPQLYRLQSHNPRREAPRPTLSSTSWNTGPAIWAGCW